MDSPPHWPRVGIGGRSQTGLGGLADFNALVNINPTTGTAYDPQFKAAWDDVKTQLIAEGQTDFSIAQSALADSFNQMSSQLGVDPAEVYSAARDYVKLGHTIMGAVNTAQGLIQTARGGNPVAFVNQFTGTMIGLATTVGPLSAGVGAAIIGVVGAIVSILEQAHLFSPAPSAGGNSAYGIPYGQKPIFLVGDLGGWPINTATQIAPGSPDWRPFPDPSNPTDAPWFADGNNGVGDWRQGYFGYGGPGSDPSWHPNRTDRPIDIAFPMYALGGHDQGGTPVAYGIEQMQGGNDFTQAFCAAWKLNAAYALNGLKPQDDWQVLAHTLRMWNRAHSDSTVWTIDRQNDSGLPWGLMGGLAGAVISANVRDVMNAAGTGLPVHMGPVITFDTASAAGSPNSNGVVTVGFNQNPMSTGEKVLLGAAAVAGAALIGTAVYAGVKHKTVGAVVQDAWSSTKRGFRR